MNSQWVTGHDGGPGHFSFHCVVPRPAQSTHGGTQCHKDVRLKEMWNLGGWPREVWSLGWLFSCLSSRYAAPSDGDADVGTSVLSSDETQQ